MRVIAGEDIPRLYPYRIDGINWVNPITLEDSGRTAMFCAMKDYKAGDAIEEFYPCLVAAGMFQNVTREPGPDDRAWLT